MSNYKYNFSDKNIRIDKDTRHRQQKKVAHRSFSNWKVGLATTTAPDAPYLAQYLFQQGRLAKKQAMKLVNFLGGNRVSMYIDNLKLISKKVGIRS